MPPDRPVRDLRFRHELYPASEKLADLASDIVEQVLQREYNLRLRLRQRKPDALAGLYNAIAVIVANLAHFVVFPGEEPAILLPLGHARTVQSEPIQPGFGKGLTAAVEGLQAVGVAVVALPTEHHQATTIAPSAGIRELVLSLALAKEDFRWRHVRDCIRLTRKDHQGRRWAVPVPMTSEAETHREEMRAINGHLTSADITYVGNDPVDTSDRLMTRHFNHPLHEPKPSLDLGGRLFGGFWQRLRRGARQHIRINGEATIELDYGQMFPRLAYAHVQASPPSGDLYALPKLTEVGPEHRSAVKKAFNALMFKAGVMRIWPPEIAKGLPSDCSVGKFRKALLARHPFLTDILNTGIGYRLMNRESCIMCRVLMGCIALGITVLPIHDAVLCPASAAFMVQQIMADAALHIAGHTVPVSVKT